MNNFSQDVGSPSQIGQRPGQKRAHSKTDKYDNNFLESQNNNIQAQ